ncbi:MAG: ribosomal RNA large subunit methyltransferase H [Rhodomicrobium sp.]|nr:MAG: ribosomal RNA large subunit methyltransferase H [Rhodomicrobium sp.]
MADLDIFAIGRLKQDAEEKLEARYLERLKKAGPMGGLRSVTITDLTESRQRGTSERKEEEATRLTERLKPQNFLIALDEKGKSLTSLAFADKLRSWIDQGETRIVFAIGGPDGHGKSLLQKADYKFSLSPLTLPHGLARILLMEQLYRAVTIWSGHPYHRE